MRIRQLVCTYNFAGVERHVATTSVELARRGHDVTVFGGDAAAMHTELAGSTVRFVDAPGAAAALRLSRRGPRPDLVHAHMTGSDLVAIATRPLLRAPIVSTLHFAQRRGHDRLTRAAWSVVPRLVDAEIAISRFVASTAGGEPAVIPNGVPAPTAANGRRPRHDVVLVAQRLESEKCTALALGAFAASGLADEGWELHVAGAGSERAHLEHEATRIGIAEATRFLGRVDDLDRRMADAALLIATAPAEPFGLSVVEAMAAGLPVVAADGGAHRETIGPATPEALFPPGDVDAAAALLRRFADDPDTRTDLAARGHRRFVASFTIEHHVDAIEKFYTGVVARSGHRRG
jgi:glycosyltransferase involved in cell wall biosynthesis